MRCFLLYCDSQVRDILTASAPHITAFLVSVLGAGGQDGLRVTVVRCYSSWLSLGAIPLSSVLASPVMGCAVQALQDSHSQRPDITAETVIRPEYIEKNLPPEPQVSCCKIDPTWPCRS